MSGMEAHLTGPFAGGPAAAQLGAFRRDEAPPDALPVLLPGKDRVAAARQECSHDADTVTLGAAGTLAS
jgi:hypothetical protein